MRMLARWHVQRMLGGIVQRNLLGRKLHDHLQQLLLVDLLLRVTKRGALAAQTGGAGGLT